MVYIVLGEGFEEIEAVAPADILRRGQVDVQYVGVGALSVAGAHGIKIEADITAQEMDLESMDMLVLPGGMGGVESMEGCPEVMDALDYAVKNDRLIGAICAAPTILARRGLLEGKSAVCYPGMEEELTGAKVLEGEAFVRDGNIITGRAPGAAFEFGLALLEALTDSSMRKTVAWFLVHGR